MPIFPRDLEVHRVHSHGREWVREKDCNAIENHYITKLRNVHTPTVDRLKPEILISLYDTTQSMFQIQIRSCLSHKLPVSPNAPYSFNDPGYASLE